ncbi:hypothetical protein HMPREF9455_01196 [Dysgonomonas gadei ATCC BAA-286]|uniref:YWFCY domain-containing protein n=1 Tax=Dysgonomonas gadei ATCC BAA-286 TaxID=742766 RepID=F5IUP6_9BACT|nr:hypothetical protein HMPREF9455_01196 [Dysgonomonas gadei ATCC BAA-286]
MDYNELQSKTISFLRFPLIVAVVFIHAYSASTTAQGGGSAPEMVYPVYDSIRYLISQVIARIAVPLFFLHPVFYFFIK